MCLTIHNSILGEKRHRKQYLNLKEFQITFIIAMHNGQHVVIERYTFFSNKIQIRRSILPSYPPTKLSLQTKHMYIISCSELHGCLRWSICSYLIKAKNATLPVHRNFLLVILISKFKGEKENK